MSSTFVLGLSADIRGYPDHLDGRSNLLATTLAQTHQWRSTTAT